MKSTTREGKGMTSRTEHQGSTYPVGRRSGGRALTAAIVLLGVILASRAAQAQTYTVLYTFTGGADGAYPQYGRLIADTSGNLYGTAPFGGDLSCTITFWGLSGCGVVFKLDLKTNEETVLYTFTGQADGALPFGGLIGDTTGNLYGTTVFGGRYGAGVIFKVDPSGHETVLHTFKYTDGANPTGELVQDKRGNLYGTTGTGGDLDGCNGYGCGVIFELDPSGKEKLLHRFTALGELYGANPMYGLIQDAAGDLYGTTQNGGDISGCSSDESHEPVITDVPGCGVIFKLDAAGRETPLYLFGPSPDGSDPRATLIHDAAGNLYGTTFFGGLYGYGTIFKLDRTGHETVLYNFTNQPDGSNPWGGLVQDEEGNLYGTANHGGGSCYCGTVFKLDPAGNYTVLHTFTGADGANPEASLLLYQGAIYGIAAGGGTAGVIFKITIP
jgi:uncharacterized repeat protein (TIGR03803 family)